MCFVIMTHVFCDHDSCVFVIMSFRCKSVCQGLRTLSTGWMADTGQACRTREM